MFEIISQFFQNQSQKYRIREKFLLFSRAQQPFINRNTIVFIKVRFYRCAPVRRKLHFAVGCVPRRLLIPPPSPSVKSHAAVRLFACKRAHDGSLLLPTFYGENAFTTAHSCYQLFTGKTCSRRLTLATNFLRGNALTTAHSCYQLFTG